MKIKDECVFSALEGRSRGMVVAERRDNGEFFMKQLALAAAVLALLSVTANAQIRQRQGATAAARRDEGVTLRPRLYGEGSA